MINQIISKVGKEVDCVLPKVIWRAIKDDYQTPFILENFGKQQLNKIKKGRYCINILLLILIVYTINQTINTKIANTAAFFQISFKI